MDADVAGSDVAGSDAAGGAEGVTGAEVAGSPAGPLGPHAHRDQVGVGAVGAVVGPAVAVVAEADGSPADAVGPAVVLWAAAALCGVADWGAAACGVVGWAAALWVVAAWAVEAWVVAARAVVVRAVALCAAVCGAAGAAAVAAGRLPVAAAEAGRGAGAVPDSVATADPLAWPVCGRAESAPEARAAADTDRGRAGPEPVAATLAQAPDPRAATARLASSRLRPLSRCGRACLRRSCPDIARSLVSVVAPVSTAAGSTYAPVPSFSRPVGVRRITPV